MLLLLLNGELLSPITMRASLHPCCTLRLLHHASTLRLPFYFPLFTQVPRPVWKAPHAIRGVPSLGLPDL